MSEPTERRKKLMQTIKDFNKSNKSEIFTMGSEIKDLEVIPSGITTFDNHIGGGFKKGAHTIIYGAYSVGKTALVLTTIANAQKNEQLVCYVNTEKPIDKSRFEFFGVDLDNLVYIEAPNSAEDALEAMRSLTKNKIIDLFIIDSTNGLCPKSSTEGKEGAERGLDKKDVAALPATLSSFYNKVNSHVFRAKSAVIWIGQLRTKGIGSYFTRDGLTGGNAQLFYAYQIICLQRCQKADNPKSKTNHYFLDPDGKMHRQGVDEEIGYGISVKIDKTNSSKSAKENEKIEIPFYYESGFNEPNFNAEVEEKFVIEGTEEEQTIIRKNLIEKGIIKEELKIMDKEDRIINEPINPEKKIKKRGRPSTKKEK